MRIREQVQTPGRWREVNRPASWETLQGDVLAILTRSTVNRDKARDAGTVETLTADLMTRGWVRLGKALYTLTP